MTPKWSNLETAAPLTADSLDEGLAEPGVEDNPFGGKEFAAMIRAKFAPLYEKRRRESGENKDGDGKMT